MSIEQHQEKRGILSILKKAIISMPINPFLSEREKLAIRSELFSGSSNVPESVQQYEAKCDADLESSIIAATNNREFNLQNVRKAIKQQVGSNI